MSADRPSPSLVQRYNDLPRYLKWITIGLCVLLMYEVYNRQDELADTWNAKADSTQAVIDKYSDEAMLERIDHQVSEGQTLWGDVHTLDSAKAEGLLRTKLFELLDANNIGDFEMPSNGTSEDTDLKIKRFWIQVEFTAPPHVVTAFLADLEREPMIARMERVTLEHVSNRAALSVVVRPEVWYKE